MEKGFSVGSYLTAILHTPREPTPNYSHLIPTHVNPNLPHPQLTILMLIKMPFSQRKCHIIKYAYDENVYLTFLSIGFHEIWVMEKDSIAEKVSIATKPKPPRLETA